MRPTLRTYHNENDYWRIREFLREVSLFNDRHDYSWSLLRWDYWRWHVNMNIFHFKLEDVIPLWEADGEIVGMLNPDGNGEAFFQFHPAYRSEELLCEMLDVAEVKFPTHMDGGTYALLARVNADDTLYKDILTRRGYVRSKFLTEHMRRRLFTQPIPFDSAHEVPVPFREGKPDSVPKSGYSVRALGDESELPARSWLSWKAFHPDEPDEKYQGWEWYKNVQRVPLYRRDLDIVAVADDGELAVLSTCSRRELGCDAR